MLIDHDLHIHTFLSRCCKTPWASFPQNIIARAAERGMKIIGLADHLWDAAIDGASAWYRPQNAESLAQRARLLPPDTLGVTVLLGCETDMRGDGEPCITPETASQMDFVLMPHSHLHIKGALPPGCDTPRKIADHMVDRFLRSLEFDYVTGIPHVFIPGNDQSMADAVVACLSDAQLADCFGRAAARGIAIEITPNYFPSLRATPDSPPKFHDETYLRVLSAARAANCLFYLASDAHSLERVGEVHILKDCIETLNITSEMIHPLVRNLKG